MKARPNKKTAESSENISPMKRNQNICNDVSAHGFVSGTCSFGKVASAVHASRAVTSLEELRTTSKNDLREITSGIYWRLTSLP